jgi:SOS response regulatory protein OraA/RecX
MLSSKEGILKKIIEIFGEAGREAINSIIDNEVEEAVARERKREIERATKALYEAKVKEEVIIQLLQDYWMIDKYQAKEATRIERTIKSQKKVLINYLQSQGYKNSDIREFMKTNNVEKQLENNQSLWRLSNSPAKLLKAVEENK